jgi:hypothetical protein
MADDEVETEEVAAPEPIEEVQMSVLDALKEVRISTTNCVLYTQPACKCHVF